MSERDVRTYELEGEVKRLKAELQAAREQSEERLLIIVTHRDNIDRLESELLAARAEIESKKRRLCNQAEWIAELKAALAQRDAEIAAHRQTIDRLERELAERVTVDSEVDVAIRTVSRINFDSAYGHDPVLCMASGRVLKALRAYIARNKPAEITSIEDYLALPESEKVRRHNAVLAKARGDAPNTTGTVCEYCGGHVGVDCDGDGDEDCTARIPPINRAKDADKGSTPTLHLTINGWRPWTDSLHVEGSTP